MAESAPRDPDIPEEPVRRRGQDFIVEQSIENDRPTGTVEPLAVLGRAYLESAGPQSVNPSRAHQFILSSLSRENPGKNIPLLPTSRVIQKLHDDVIPADRAAIGDQIKQENRTEERSRFIRTAVLHYTLPEIARTITLQVELRSLRREKEADSLSALLEAFGRVIDDTPHNASVLVWARYKRFLRENNRGL